MAFISNGIVWYDDVSIDSGTGNYGPFVRLQAKEEESGVNTDTSGVLDNKDGIWTHSLQYSSIITVTRDFGQGEQQYVEFRLDLNDSPNDITLTDLQIYLSSAPATSDDFTGFKLVYDLPVTLELLDQYAGSGNDDYGFFIPVSLFEQYNTTTFPYVTLYSSFENSDGGFEEWRTQSTEGPNGGNETFAYTIDKTVTDVDGVIGAEVDEAGDIVNYQIVVTNTGTGAITGVVVEDPLLGVLGGPIESISANGTLDVGETWTYTGSYTVKQADIDTDGGGDHDIDNTATVVSDQVGEETDSAAVLIDYNPKLTITKTAVLPAADLDGKIDSPDDDITYTIAVTNTGNVSLTGVLLTDTLPVTLGNPVQTGGDASLNNNNVLDVGETWTYTTTYNVTQADIDNKGAIDTTDDLKITNVATVDTDQTTPQSGTAITDIFYDPKLTITKNADKSVVDAAGQVITYTIDVKNDGNVTLTGVNVTDPFATGLTNDANNDGDIDGDTNDNQKLDVGETWHWTATHTVTAEEILSGDNIVNVAFVDCNETEEEQDDAVTAVVLTSDGYSQGYWKTHTSGKNAAWNDTIATNTGYEDYLGIDTGLTSSLSFKGVLDTASLKPVQANHELALAKQVVAAFLNAADSTGPNATSDFQFTAEDIRAAVASVYDNVPDANGVTGFYADDDGDGIRDSAELQMVLDFYNKENVVVQGTDPMYMITLTGTNNNNEDLNFLTVFGS